MSRLQWWGYRHVNGTLHLKRYLSFGREAIADAHESDFVQDVCGPFYADSRVEAIAKLKKGLPGEESRS